MSKIKTHAERVQSCTGWCYCGDSFDIELYRAEIADLRAALASSATTEPVNGEFKQKLNKLIQDCTDLAFDCGEFAEITPSTVDAYEKIVSASEAADQALRDFVIGAVLGARSAAALAKQVPAQEPDLYRAEKLVPYETRYFGTKGMAERLGYKVSAAYKRIDAQLAKSADTAEG